MILGQQYITARLNESNGAAVPPEVGVALAQAYVWFITHSPGETYEPDASERNLAISLSEIFDTYNNGWNYPTLPG